MSIDFESETYAFSSYTPSKGGREARRGRERKTQIAQPTAILFKCHSKFAEAKPSRRSRSSSSSSSSRRRSSSSSGTSSGASSAHSTSSRVPAAIVKRQKAGSKEGENWHQGHQAETVS